MSFKFEKLSVLIVEDTEAMGKLVASVLDSLGVKKIYMAADGETGYEKFCDKKPDIVITDWYMEPMSGIELIDKIRTNQNSPNKTIPVIMMTGFSAIHRVMKARDMGATEFLVKPFSAGALAKRIAYVISKPRDFIKTDSYFGPDRRRRIIADYKGPLRRSKDQIDLKRS